MLDISPAGLFTTFLVDSEVEKVAARLPTLTPTKIAHHGQLVVCNEDESIILDVPRTTATLKPLDGLPKGLLQFTKPRGAKFKLLKLLSNITALVSKKGFNLSQIVLGNSIDATPARICQLLSELVKDGLLEIIDEHYVPGLKAKTYIAKGALKVAIREHKTHLKKRPTPPDHIEDNTWHDTLLAVLLRHFKHQPNKFLKWVKTLPDHQLNDRLNQAERLAEWWTKTSSKKAL
jgi:hypothetical protein